MRRALGLAIGIAILAAALTLHVATIDRHAEPGVAVTLEVG